MIADHNDIPPGCEEKYRRTEDLLEWMSQGFDRCGDIYRTSIYGSSVYVTRNPGHAHRILVGNWQNYVKGHFIKRIAILLGNGLMVSEGEFWKDQRRMIQPAFNRSAIEVWTKLITHANIDLLEKWTGAAQRGDTVNVTHDVSLTVLKVVLVATFGNDYEQVAQPFGILLAQPNRNPQFARDFRSLSKLVLQVIDERRKARSASTDFLGMLMRARDAQGQAMPDGQLINEILTLIVAGHDTTASSLNWIWYLISQHPDVQQRLSDELDKRVAGDKLPELDDLGTFIYTQRIIEESLRLYPPGWLMTRKALGDDHLGEYFVPAGTEVFIPPFFIQRNPDFWEEPDRFNPDRFGSSHLQGRRHPKMLAFSAGPRNCIGEFLARAEMQIQLIVIAKHLRLHYSPTKPLELDAGVNLRNKHDFVMTPEPKKSTESIHHA